MRTKKGIFLAALAATMVLGFASVSQAAKTYVSIATGGTSGTYYPIGGAIAAAVYLNGKPAGRYSMADLMRDSV